MWCYMRNELDTTKRLQSDLSRSEGTNLWSSNYKSLWSHTSFKSLWRRTYKWLQSDLCSLMHCQSDQLIKAINTITHSYMHGNERCVHVVLWSYLTTICGTVCINWIMKKRFGIWYRQYVRYQKFSMRPTWT